MGSARPSVWPDRLLQQLMRCLCAFLSWHRRLGGPPSRALALSLPRHRNLLTGAAVQVIGGAFLLMLLLASASALGALPSALGANLNWTGKWETRWRGGGAEVILTQEGNKVTGSYPLYGGR